MSGHNKWSQIKRQKDTNDLKRAKIFTKLSKAITLAAKNGEDVKTNAALRVVVDKAKQINMPVDNINKAIKKGVGGLDSDNLSEVLFEAYGPSGVAFLIEATTTNNNRTVAEIKHILNNYDGRLGEKGSVQWMFERWGYLELNDVIKTASREDVELVVIELGADDVVWLDNVLVIYVQPVNLYLMKESLEAKGWQVKSSGFEWRAKNKVVITPDVMNKVTDLFNMLDEHDDVNEIYSNLE